MPANPLRRPRTAFPERAGHRYALLVDGERFLPAMLQAIEAARRYVLLELYLVEDGHCAGSFVDALCRAAQRGVAVFILLDGYGGRGLSEAHRQALAAAGVQLAFFNPLSLHRWRLSLWRDHRKLLLVDGEIAFTGGMGMTDDFDPAVRGEAAWHEVMLEIRGPCVQDWQKLFEAAWRRWCTDARRLPSPSRTIDSAGGGGQVLGEFGHDGRAVMSSTIAAMGRSRSRIWLATGYFVPTGRLRRALVRAARRGVDVRLLLPGPHTDHPSVWHAGRRFYGRLLRSGVKIYEYQPRFLHAKFLLCDQWASVGSSNLDHWTLRWNLEANQAVMDEDLAGALARLFEQDFAQSLAWQAEDWRARGRWQRFKEWLFGGLDDWLMQLGDRYALRMESEK